MQTILVVDDEPAIREVFKAILGGEGFRVLTAGDAPTAIATVQRDKPDLMLLDVTLPGGISGFDICQKLREQGAKLPILMVTARVTEAERVIGLSLGADDYITKPFSNMEVVARVKAHLRQLARHAADSQNEELTVGNLSIDARKRVVSIDGQEVPLRHKEFELLFTLVHNIGLVMSREQLIRKVWGDDFEGEDRVVDVHMFRIRDALKPFPTSPIDIQAVRSVGYRCALRDQGRKQTAELGRRHAFALPEDQEQLLPLLAGYLKEQAGKGGTTALFGSAATFDRLFSALHGAGLQPQELFCDRRLRHLDASSLGTAGRFAPELFQEHVNGLLEGGDGRSITLLLETPFILGWTAGTHPDDDKAAQEDIQRYEQAVDALLTAQSPTLAAICCYDLPQLSGHVSLRCLQGHPLVLQEQKLQANSIYRPGTPST